MEKRHRVTAIALAGGAASAALTLYVGRGNRSVLLVAMFVCWVLSPFVALVWTARRDPAPSLRVAALIAAASVLLYAMVALVRPRTPAFAFLAVPAASWVVLALARRRT